MWLWCAVLASAAAGGAGWRAAPLGPAAFAVETVLQLAEETARARHAACKLSATLRLAPAHSLVDGDQQLLHFTLSSVRVQTLGVRARSEWAARRSAWDAVGAREGFVRRGEGRVLRAWLQPGPSHARDYERALLSLLTFAPDDAPRNETDASGACEALYETLAPDSFRKVKRRCAWERGGVSARRVARYSGGAGGLRALHAEEVLVLAGPGAAPPLKARSWHALRRLDEEAPAPGAAHAHLAAALAALPPHLLELELPLEAPDDDDEREDLEAAIEQSREALDGAAPGAGGRAGAAAALLRLLPALQRAPEHELLRALQAREHDPSLAGLCHAAGLAGTEAGVRAAERFLQLGAREPLLPLARAFLAGLALAPEPRAEAALRALRLGLEARHAGLGEAALLAGAAAAAREARAPAEDLLLRALARCADAACRRARLLALANVGGVGAEPLLAHAERGERGAAAAALRALRRGAPLSSPQLERLGRLATDGSAALEVRAAALDLLLERRLRRARESGAAPAQVSRVLRALVSESGAGAGELVRLAWGALEAADAGDAARYLPRELRGWAARAAAGSSSLLRRHAGWAWLRSRQLARAAVLRHGTVTLLHPRGDGEDEELEVELSTSGLEALAGAGGEGDAEEGEEARGVLALAVGGARAADLVLFEGQAQLLAHVWAGTGSSPTPVLRALRPARAVRAALPLQAGAWLQARAAAATALALDAHAAVSLWHRTARGALELRAGRAAAAELRVRAPWPALAVRSQAAAEPRLRVAVDLDFYDEVALCVRAHVPTHNETSAVRLESSAARRGWEARREAPGRTLALDRRNDAACRTLQPHDDD